MQLWRRAGAVWLRYILARSRGIEFAAYRKPSIVSELVTGRSSASILRLWRLVRGDSYCAVVSPIATWLAVSLCRSYPVPVETDEKTYNINPEQIEAAITPKTKAPTVHSLRSAS